MWFKGVPIFNKRPRNLRFGGFVKSHPKMTKKQLDNDSILAYLMPNEIVIPVRHSRKVAEFLKKEHIKLPGL